MNSSKYCIDCKKELNKPELYIRCFNCNSEYLIKAENLKEKPMTASERRIERRALNIRPFMREAREE